MAKDKEKIDMEAMRHSCEHVLTMAMLRIWGNKVKAAMGPSTDEGFYFDFDSEIKITEEDLRKIEKEMARIIRSNFPIIKDEMSIKEAREFFGNNIYKGNEYKHEWIDEIEKRGEKVSVYWMGEKGKDIPNTFGDICAGPHVASTGKIGPFKLTSIAGAYWHGDERNKMLTRIYGVCFPTREELDAYLHMIEEAKKRDHRKLGKELEIFIFDEDVGPGLPLWLPNGGVLIEQLERLAKKMEDEGGYLRVKTPHLAKESMYLKSGHLPHYQESMFPPMELDGVKYYMKAMNCPHHHKIFDAIPRSYRDMPMRLAEYGTCYRYEQTGELFGLMRVRSMQMNDAHIYCRPDQVEQEFKAVNELYLKYFKIFGIEKYMMRFSTHNPAKLGEKYINEPKLWKQTEDIVREILVRTKMPFVEVNDEAAFYGPKIDIQVWSAIGREFTLATNQVDFCVPKRFGLNYTNEKGEKETPLCIHRAPLSTHERFVGFLLEHYAGAFPVWLAPVQVAILPVSDKFNDYAGEVGEALKKARIRYKLDDNNESLGKKIRNAEMMKIPYMLVVGEKEVADKSVAVRDYATKKQEVMKTGKFVDMVKEMTAEVLG